MPGGLLIGARTLGLRNAREVRFGSRADVGFDSFLCHFALFRRLFVLLMLSMIGGTYCRVTASQSQGR